MPPISSWLAAYTGRGHQAQHLATGVLLVLAALSLMSLLNALWRRIAEAQRPAAISPLPLVAAGVSAACIAAGGVVMAYVSGGELIGTYPLPAVDILRLSNDLGFALVSVAGMLAAALSVACLSIQGRAAGILGRKMTVFGLLVAVLLLAALAFVPILPFLLWVVVVSITLMRAGTGRSALIDRGRPA